MAPRPKRSITWTCLSIAAVAGCASPYRSDQGALYGGLGGAGVGALVGNASGHPLAGAAIGAGVGALSGAAVGGALDNIEANNRAQIEARLGRPVLAGSVTTGEVIAMSRAGVQDDLIINHIRSHGAAVPPQSNDLIALQQNGVNPRVVEALQAPPMVMAAAPPPPVYIQQPMVPPPYWGPPPYRYYYR